MMKWILMLAAIFCVQAQAKELGSLDLGFKAPAINDKDNAASPELGAILLDTSDNVFYGNFGTPASPSWLPLSNNASGPRSEVYTEGVGTGSGFGSNAGNVIRTWPTPSVNIGSDITFAQDAVNGDTFTINASGVYTMTYAESFATANYYGFSKNSNQLTTSLYSITAADRLIYCAAAPSDYIYSCSVTTNLDAGDVIRAHTQGGPLGTNASRTSFRITKVSN